MCVCVDIDHIISNKYKSLKCITFRYTQRHNAQEEEWVALK